MATGQANCRRSKTLPQPRQQSKVGMLLFWFPSVRARPGSARSGRITEAGASKIARDRKWEVDARLSMRGEVAAKADVSPHQARQPSVSPASCASSSRRRSSIRPTHRRRSRRRACNGARYRVAIETRECAPRWTYNSGHATTQRNPRQISFAGAGLLGSSGFGAKRIIHSCMVISVGCGPGVRIGLETRVSTSRRSTTRP